MFPQTYRRFRWRRFTPQKSGITPHGCRSACEMRIRLPQTLGSSPLCASCELHRFIHRSSINVQVQFSFADHRRDQHTRTRGHLRDFCFQRWPRASHGWSSLRSGSNHRHGRFDARLSVLQRVLRAEVALLPRLVGWLLRKQGLWDEVASLRSR